MFRPAALLFALLLPLPAAKPKKPLPDGPTYTADGQLKLPTDYREWIFLGSGIDMSYNPQASAPDHSMFNGVFVNPSAYREFKQTGQWPEGTMLMLENRGARGDQSINKRGQTETSEVMGREVHVKDSAHIKGTWGFYSFDDANTAKLIERPAACYTCHEQHGVLDTTFVQFYPVALDIARQKNTIDKQFLKELPTSAPVR